jgi:hypothetical protein
MNQQKKARADGWRADGCSTEHLDGHPAVEPIDGSDRRCAEETHHQDDGAPIR